MECDFVEIYKQYVDLANSDSIELNNFPVNYDVPRLSNGGTISIELFVYSQMLDDFRVGIPNSINEFGNLIFKLLVWRDVFKTIDLIDHKYVVLSEFINPIATQALCYPYALKSRIEYAIAHLSNQANWFRSDITIKDDLPKDRKINTVIVNKYAAHWECFEDLKIALSKTNIQFDIETKDYRNKYTHRYSLPIEIGLGESILRHPIEKIENESKEDTVKANYQIGSNPPLTLDQICSSLIDEYSRFLNVYSQFKCLTLEQITFIKTYKRE